MPRDVKNKRKRVVRGELCFSTNSIKGIICKRFNPVAIYTATLIPKVIKIDF